MRRCAVLLSLAIFVGACSEDHADGPPTVHLGDSTCDHCGMIISDGRFASATIIEGPRGSEALLFDDFNCQIGYESDHDDVVVMARWVRDYDTSEWLPASDATFLASHRLHTPMASQTAAFASEAGAQSARDELGGELLTLDDLGRHFTDD
jgi:copper chaperone NosL